MPIYEYACNDCNHTLDALQKLSEEPLKFCPECGAESLRKLISAPNFRLKGSGWYETDFKTGKRKNIAGDSGSDSGQKDGAKDGSKDGGKDSKTDSKKDGQKDSKKEGKKDAGKSASSDSGASSSSKSGGKASANAASSAD